MRLPIHMLSPWLCTILIPAMLSGQWAPQGSAERGPSPKTPSGMLRAEPAGERPRRSGEFAVNSPARTRGLAAQTAAAGPGLRVDAAATRHAISQDVYGVNSYGNMGATADLHLPLTRWGGNATSQYNWKLDSSNTGGDWYFEIFPQNDSADPSKLPDGSAHDVFHETNLKSGARSYSTVPIMDWVAGTRVAKTCSFSVRKYGAQKATDQYAPDCGNGTLTSGAEVASLPNFDPADSDVKVDAAFMTDWVKYTAAKYGNAAQGGVAVWSLDNEPIWWMGNHKNIHLQPFTYDELAERGIRYAKAIKSGDRSAAVAGPVSAGYWDLFFSALDIKSGWGGPSPWKYWTNPVDRKAHGDIDLTAWYLQQFAKAEQETGYRLLDYLDVHGYMPGTGGDALDAASVAARLQSPRVFWDPNYIFTHDDYLASEPVNLIGRMKQWIADNYPGTKTAITEYNLGAFDDISGALAQADLLGAFGREGLDLATLWGNLTKSVADPANPGKNIDVPNVMSYAFRLYRNYDGQGGAFGETSVSAASDNQDQLAIYAAQRSDSALTLMVINKTANDLSSNVALNNFQPDGAVQVWQYSGANLGAIVRQPDQSTTANGVGANFPAYSATLLIVPESSALKAAKPVITAIVNAATNEGGIAPGTLVNVTGANLGPATGGGDPISGKSGIIGTNLSNVRVLFNGAPAPVLSASSTSVLAMVPYTAALNATASVQAEYKNSRSDPITVQIAPAAPGVFTADATGKGPALAFSFDAGVFALTLNSALTPVSAGSSLLFYITGAGVLNPPAVDGRIEAAILPQPAQNVAVTIGGKTATATTASAPGSISGILLVNVTVPGGVTAGNAPLVVTVGGASSQGGVTLAVK